MLSGTGGPAGTRYGFRSAIGAGIAGRTTRAASVARLGDRCLNACFIRSLRAARVRKQSAKTPQQRLPHGRGADRSDTILKGARMGSTRCPFRVLRPEEGPRMAYDKRASTWAGKEL